MTVSTSRRGRTAQSQRTQTAPTLPPAADAPSPLGRIVSQPGRMLRAVRHVTQRPTRFRFEVLVEDVRLRVPRDTTIAIEWARGPKRARSKEFALVKTGTNGPPSDAFDEPLVLLATLFKPGGAAPSETGGTATASAEAVPFAPKPSKLQVVEMVASSGRLPVAGRCIAECSFDLANYARDFGGAFERVTLPLKKSLDSRAEITFVIGCNRVSSVGDEDIDSLSQRSNFMSLESLDAESLSRTPSFGPSKGSATSRFARRVRHDWDTGGEGAARRGSTSRSDGVAPETPAKRTGCDDPDASEDEVPTVVLPENLLRCVCPNCGESLASDAEIVVISKRAETLEESLAEAQEELKKTKEQFMARVASLDESLDAERSRVAAAAEEKRRVQSEKDDAVSGLLNQIEGMHLALERARQMDELDSPSLSTVDSNIPLEGRTQRPFLNAAHPSSPQSGPRSPARAAQPSVLEVSLKEEIGRLRQRLDEDRDEIEAFHKIIDREKERYRENIHEMRRLAADEKKQLMKSVATLEQKVSGQMELNRSLETAKTAEESRRKQLETHLRESVTAASVGKNTPRAGHVLNQEIAELSAARDELRRQNLSERLRLTNELQSLHATNKHQSDSFRVETAKLNAERKMLRQRIAELETEVSKAPRPSMVTRLAAEGTPRVELSRLMSQQERLLHDTRLDPTTHEQLKSQQVAAVEEGERIAARVLELEEELVKTKVQLADSEQLRDEQTVKARRKFDALRAQHRTYATLVSDLEVQVSDLKVRAATRGSNKPRMLHSVKHWASRNRKPSSKQPPPQTTQKRQEGPASPTEPPPQRRATQASGHVASPAKVPPR